MQNSPEPHVSLDGKEQQPTLILDDFWPGPDVLREDAAMLRLQPIGPHYPGLRATIPPMLAERMRQRIAPLLATHFDLDPAPAVSEAYYSLVTTPPGDLAPIQRLPHFDGVEDRRIALLLFLGHGPQGGTAFYRERTTGFERISAERLAPYRTGLDAAIRQYGLPEPAYIEGDTPLFEQIARHDACHNRALVYRGNRLHCAWLPDTVPITGNPLTGRLTLNLFLFD